MVEESDEGRRRRLRSRASERVARLANHERVLPHSILKADTNSACGDCGKLASQLIETGFVGLTIGSHLVEISRDTSFGVSNWWSLSVDGTPIEAALRGSTSLDGQPLFYVEPYGDLRTTLLDTPWDRTTFKVTADLFDVLALSLFNYEFRDVVSGYVAERRKKLELELIAKRQREESLQREQEALQLARQIEDRKRSLRIRREAERFRNVLLRKYKQLVFVDEYETTDESRFMDELKRFATKRLPDLDAGSVAINVRALVVSWLESGADAEVRPGFDPAMTPQDYERYCADLLSSTGWSARLTPASGDQGADIICSGAGMRMVVQCKLYSSAVGNGAVQEVIAAKQFQFADAAAVVSNADYTRAAKELASAAGVLLLHHEALAGLTPAEIARKLGRKDAPPSSGREE